MPDEHPVKAINVKLTSKRVVVMAGTPLVEAPDRFLLIFKLYVKVAREIRLHIKITANGIKDPTKTSSQERSVS